MNKNIDEFMRKHATGINIKEEEVGKFPIQLHNTKTQKAIVNMYSFVEREEYQVQKDINNLMDLKKRALEDMLV